MTITPSIFLVAAPVVCIGWYVCLIRTVRGRNRRARAEARAAVEQARTKKLVSKPLLTPNEVEFHGRLKRAAEPLGLEVMTQVSMGAILDVALPEDHPIYWDIRNKFARKIIDFVICTPDGMQVLGIVELDDSTHDREKDAARDAMLEQAGFTTIRWNSRSKPSVEKIAEAFKWLVDNHGKSASH
ncbi:DUF2726 domain-containing protein [Paraburkholderia sp. UCT31]|uniref:DUF2726 domain-containing protein n=1 Tax=Paraburkholderia sp. UCT31 TaxID=2615209 RepID=UPI00165654D8|nr:DUF2726 domain-containing protein [Paraburkholderia sp. UCT31]